MDDSPIPQLSPGMLRLLNPFTNTMPDIRSSSAIPGLQLWPSQSGNSSGVPPSIPPPSLSSQGQAANPLLGGVAPAQSTSLAISAPIPAAAPLPPTQTQVAQSELNREINTGPGVGQIHNPFFRGLARAADIAGSVFLPGVSMAIPGTTLHHDMLVGQARGNLASAQANALTAAKQSQEDALAQQEQAKAQALTDPRKAIDPSKTVQTDGGVYQLDPATGKYDVKVGDPQQKPVSLGQAHATAVEKAVQEGRDPSQDPTVNYLANALIGLQPGQNKPADAPKTIPIEVSGKPHQMAWNPVTSKYDLDQGESGEKPPVVNNNAGTWSLEEDGQGKPILLNNKTGQTKDAPGGVQKPGTTAKANAPYQAIVDEAQQAHQLAAMAESGNAPADVDLALSFFKTMRGTGGAGIRFTQAEQNLIMGARSMGGDLQGVAQKVLGGGQKFTPEQRNNILKVIDLHAQAAQQHLQGPTQQPTTSQPTPQPSSAPAHSLATAMALPFNKGKSSAQVSADLQAHGYRVVP